jgi:DNA-binding transcriptional ArsR family regulator
MPKQLSNEQRREILKLRALDYTKEEIADAVGVSRNTVSRHLTDMRKEIESRDPDNQRMALAEILFEPEELLPFVLEQSGMAFSDLSDEFLKKFMSPDSNED